MNYTAFRLAKVGLNKFRTRFGPQNVKIMRERQHPSTMTLFWKRMSQRAYITQKEKRSEYKMGKE